MEPSAVDRVELDKLGLAQNRLLDLDSAPFRRTVSQLREVAVAAPTAS